MAEGGAWTPTAELPLHQDEEHGSCAVAANKSTTTQDGSVDWSGKPSNQALVTFSVNCVGTNLVTFMSVVMRLDNADAANKANNWNGTTYVFSIARHEHCQPPTRAQSLVLYISIYQIALGNGAYQPAMTTLGADQFDETDAGERKSKSAFFGYFFVANNLGGVLAVTAVAYIEDRGQWALAFWISTSAALAAVLLFSVGTLRYRHFLPAGNAVVSVCQVIVAATRKRRVRVKAPQDLYEKADGGGARKQMVHTPEFRCLDKAAAVVTAAADDHHQGPWRLCTVTQVEELKCILRLAPLWLCSILFSTSFSQMASVFIEQAQAMDGSLGKLQIPAAGMGVFEILGVTAFVFIYSFCIVKVMSRVWREPTELERMGIGLVISTLAMLTAGMVEQQRLRQAITTTTTTHKEPTSSLSILWQIPQYVLIGASEVFMYVTMTEFFNDQLPEGLRSLGSAMSVASMSAGNFVSSLLVTVVMATTTKGGRAGWIPPQDLNRGHVDRFFFVIAALNALDLLAYIVFAKRYRPAPMLKPLLVVGESPVPNLIGDPRDETLINSEN
nr:unnamed protein product [Digitaria exilis]